MPRELDSLVQLQLALNEADTARRQLAGIPDSLLPIHEQHHHLLEVIQRLEGEIEADEKLRRSAELEATAAAAKLETYQVQINRVTTQREYGALLKEIDTIKAKVSVHEDEALALLERQEKARAELATARAEFATVDSRYQELLGLWQQERPAVEARLRDVVADIDRLRALIPGHPLRQFELLYQRLGGDALSTVTRMQGVGRSQAAWHCSVCNYRVRPQIIVEIKTTGALVQCERCHRFLRVEDSV
jgi:hypothetical protein